jgi:hypothetical protein
MMRCIHCEKAITSKQTRFTYPLSKRDAHLSCVSLISLNETDAYLKTEQESNTRLVYSTGAVIPKATRNL